MVNLATGDSSLRLLHSRRVLARRRVVVRGLLVLGTEVEFLRVASKGRQMAVVSCYAQGRESNRWKWEDKKMADVGGGGDRTPAMQYRDDLGMVVQELEAQKVCVVLGGDFNFAWAPMYEGV